MRGKLRFAVMALALAGCGKSQTVDKPLAQVLVTLSSLPGDADAMWRAASNSSRACSRVTAAATICAPGSSSQVSA